MYWGGKMYFAHGAAGTRVFSTKHLLLQRSASASGWLHLLRRIIVLYTPLQYVCCDVLEA